jgi:hypothetical protein
METGSAVPVANPVTPSDANEALIGGTYAVDPRRPLPDAGGGVAAFAAHDRRPADRPSGRGGLMALAVPAGLAPRATTPLALAGPLEGVLAPLALGPGPHAAGGAPGLRTTYVICPAPPGPPLTALPAPWPEAALLEQVLRPAAHALHLLAARGLTHRAIRPDNVFRAGPGQPVVLGAAWAAPPAMHQPAANEPPYVAMCLPAGRGEGSIADDVYALGVLLLTLAAGAPPLAGLAADAIIRRKLDHGSFEALAAGIRLPSLLADLLRGMLAEDPDHRPPPALLADPAAARVRRIAARPPRRAQRALRIGAAAVNGARALAYAIAVAPEAGLAALRNGTIDLWLRRDLGDATLSMRLEETLRLRGADRGAETPSGEALLLVRAGATLDPLAPVAWPGAVVWPDGLGAALASAIADGAPGAGTSPLSSPLAGADTPARLLGLVQAEAVAAWAEIRGARADPLPHRAAARQWRTWLQTPGFAGGIRRLVYELDPLLPCASRLLAGRAVSGLAALPAALDALATPTPPDGDGPVDADIMAFIAARQERGAAPGGEPGHGAAAGAVPPLVQMEVLARLQARFHPGKLPGLARWLAVLAAPMTEAWRHRSRRAALAEQLSRLAEDGMIAPMLALLRDPASRQADASGFFAAMQDLAGIDAALRALDAGGPARAALARQWGQELAAGIGLAALALVLGIAALG